MFGRCNCSCCRREASDSFNFWKSEIEKQKDFTIDSFELGQSIDKPDGIYFVYARCAIGKYLDVKDKHIQLVFEKKYTLKLWARIFGLHPPQPDDFSLKNPHSSIIVESGIITYLNKHKYHP